MRKTRKVPSRADYTASYCSGDSVNEDASDSDAEQSSGSDLEITELSPVKRARVSDLVEMEAACSGSEDGHRESSDYDVDIDGNIPNFISNSADQLPENQSELDANHMDDDAA